MPASRPDPPTTDGTSSAPDMRPGGGINRGGFRLPGRAISPTGIRRDNPVKGAPVKNPRMDAIRRRMQKNSK